MGFVDRLWRSINERKQAELEAKANKMKIVFISDTHKMHDQVNVPDGDVLVHAGDISGRGSLQDVASFAAWFNKLPHQHKILIAGNHDFCFENELRSEAINILGDDVNYLEDSEVIIDGVKFWGSPWQPEFCNWAFNLPRGVGHLKEKWDLIPEDTDVLITHGPPHGYGDFVAWDQIHVGCEEMLEALDRVKPKIHVFGHIHEGYGEFEHNGIKLINASVCTAGYDPINAPFVVEI
jgi:Icc-related predicted phosphoesterase